MKLNLIPITLFVFALLFGQSSMAHTIKGTIHNAQLLKNDSVFIFEYLGGIKTKLAGSKIVKDQYKIKLNDAAKGRYFIGTEADKGFDFLVWNKDLTIDLNAQSIGTYVNEDKETTDFKAFNQKLMDTQKDLQKIYSDRNTKMQKLRSQAAADSVIQFYKDLETKKDQELDSFLKSFADKKNYLGELSRYILGPNKSIFQPEFSAEDYNNAYASQGEFQFVKTTYYIKYKYSYTAEGYEKGIIELLNKAPGYSNSRRLLNYMLFDFYASMDTDKLETLLGVFLAEYPKDAQGLAYKSRLPKPQPKVGQAAPDIVLNDREGKQTKLSSLKGKVVLLDFWASWCGPCRHENPNVVKVYNKYKEQGFTVFSVSLDDNQQKWLQAIEKDGLAWEWHVSDLQGWRSAGAALYAVTSIPATFLIGKDGKIVAKNLRGEALEQKVKEIVAMP